MGMAVANLYHSLPLTSLMMTHALYGYGLEPSQSLQNEIVRYIINSAELDNIVQQCKINAEGDRFYFSSTKIAFDSTADLFLSIHKAIINVNGWKGQNGLWSIYVMVFDTYDFAIMAKSGLTAYINNYAFILQESGALIPYKWRVTFSYKEPA